jgi:hypothetical protein
MKFKVKALDVNNKVVWIKLDDDHNIYQSINFDDVSQYVQPHYDDLRFSATTLKQGATSKPDFDYTNIGLLFPQNDTSEAIYIVAQMPHSWKEGTNIFPHVHARLSGSGQPVMKMDYKWYNPSEATIPSSFTTYTLDTNTATWSTGTISTMIMNSTPIDGTGKTASSIIIIKLYRDDNVYSGDLLVDEFDIHYLVDDIGDDADDYDFE